MASASRRYFADEQPPSDTFCEVPVSRATSNAMLEWARCLTAQGCSPAPTCCCERVAAEVILVKTESAMEEQSLFQQVPTSPQRLRSQGDNPLRTVMGAHYAEPLVPLETARRFLEALEARYLHGDETAVEDFFRTLPPLENAELLHRTEQIVRRSREPAKMLPRVAAKWRLADTRSGHSASPLANVSYAKLGEAFGESECDRPVATPQRASRMIECSAESPADYPLVVTKAGREANISITSSSSLRSLSVCSDDVPALGGAEQLSLGIDVDLQDSPPQTRRSQCHSPPERSRTPSRSPSRSPSRTPRKRGLGSLGGLDVVFGFVQESFQDIKRGPGLIPRMSSSD
eukprot:TRINITY_DN71106_c0_g1_i1.p1 TRINITY_DN71106_c0_g1~~TRINITY_DN71106_c0_g1_i1.p1  ORF type:complete len:365 (+),score=62.21 TRINITY_DN71106_c0_g1_i1:58-1095(+)